MTKKNYYVYLHQKMTNDEPFYVGKGKGKRAYSPGDRNKIWHNVVNKHGYRVVFLATDLTEEESHDIEKYWIKKIGRIDLGTGPLVNLTDGGEGISGYKFTKEQRENVRLANLNRKKYSFSEQALENMRKSANLRRGINNLTQEGREKISKIHKGVKKSEETRKKMSNFLYSDKNPRNKKVVAEGVEYYSLSHCSREIGISTFFIKKYCNDPSKNNWYFV